MIDIKATIKESGLNQSSFGRLIGRKPEQVNRWYNGRRMLSPMMEEHVRRICNDNGIEVIDKKS